MDSDLVLHLHEKLYRKSSENTSGTTLSYGKNHTGDVSASASRLVDIKCENDSYARTCDPYSQDLKRDLFEKQTQNTHTGTALPSDKLSRCGFDIYVCFVRSIYTILFHNKHYSNPYLVLEHRHRLYKLTMRLRGMILPNKDLRQCMISLCAVSSVILFGVIAALLYRTFELDSFFLVFSTCAVVSVFLVFYVLRRRDSARSDGRVVVIGTAITFILVALAVTIVVISIQKMQHPTISSTLSMMSSNTNSGVLSNFDTLSKSNVASRRVLSTNTAAHPELGALASPIFGAISLCAILIILVTMDNFLGLTSFSFGLFDDAGTFGGSKAVSWEASYGPLHMWLDGFEGNNSIIGNGGKKHDDDGDAAAVVDHADTKKNSSVFEKSKLSDNDDDDDDDKA